MSFANELKNIYQSKKAELLEKKEENLERRAKDITRFFEKEIQDQAKERMRARAEQGRPTANILEYQYNERFYVNEEGEIVRFIENEVSYPNYRIHDVVMRDHNFQVLLDEIEKTVSSEESPIRIVKWRPRDGLHVVEAVWGKNRYHNTYRTQESRIANQGRGMRGRGTGRMFARGGAHSHGHGHGNGHGHGHGHGHDDGCNHIADTFTV